MAKQGPMPPRAEWTADDWRDLYRAIEAANRRGIELFIIYTGDAS